MLPFDLDHLPDLTWPEDFRPVGEATAEKEAFARWWQRNHDLRHLPAALCERWVYRHWTGSPFSFIPLDTLECRRETWDGERILRSIYRAWGGELHQQFDYETFQRGGGDDRLQTAVALDSGTWDYPMVLLATPHGIIDAGEARSEVRLVVVEGHQRHRYLNALPELGYPPVGPHEIFILSTPLTDRVSTHSAGAPSGE